MLRSQLTNSRKYELSGPNVQVKAVYLAQEHEWLLIDEWSRPRKEWKVDPHGSALLTLNEAEEWRPDGNLTLDDVHEMPQGLEFRGPPSRMSLPGRLVGWEIEPNPSRGM